MHVVTPKASEYRNSFISICIHFISEASELFELHTVLLVEVSRPGLEYQIRTNPPKPNSEGAPGPRVAHARHRLVFLPFEYNKCYGTRAC